MLSLKNRWMILFVVGMSAITIFGSLLTSNEDIKVKDSQEINHQINM